MNQKKGQLVRVVVAKAAGEGNEVKWVTQEQFQAMLEKFPRHKSFSPYPAGYFGFTGDGVPRQTLSDEENLAYPPMSLEELRSFVAGHQWTFAKTMPFLPHYYVVDEKARDLREFKRFIAHIRRAGVGRPFYYRQIQYLDLDGWKYWTMGYPIDPPPGVEEEGIINRALLDSARGQLSKGAGDAEERIMSSSAPLPQPLRGFIAASQWTYAKTMPRWPHEYIVRERVDEKLFLQLVRHIREHGFEGRFYEMKLIYFEEDGMIYWTMGAPIDETTIINRCTKENSYESRLRNGTLPK